MLALQSLACCSALGVCASDLLRRSSPEEGQQCNDSTLAMVPDCNGADPQRLRKLVANLAYLASQRNPSSTCSRVLFQSIESLGLLLI